MANDLKEIKSLGKWLATQYFLLFLLDRSKVKFLFCSKPDSKSARKLKDTN